MTHSVDPLLCSVASSYLGVEPILSIPAVIVYEGLILAPHFIQNTVQIDRRGSIHLYIESVSKLTAK